MTLPGETVATGAKLPEVCPPDEVYAACGEPIRLQVCKTPAGYYIGYRCACTPWTRESGYYRTRDEAEKALAEGGYWRP